MKCARCGRGLLFSGKVKLYDAVICAQCFKELKFTVNDLPLLRNTKLEDALLGSHGLAEKMAKAAVLDEFTMPTIRISGAGEERDVVCTEEEREIYEDVLDAMLKNEGVEPNDVRLVRVAKNYVTIKFLDGDLMRYKYTSNAKWLCFPYVEAGQVHHEISSPEDLYDYADLLQEEATIILGWHKDDD